jgi:ubiquinone/menaquinone biosynthesis C-methylase UbiE
MFDRMSRQAERTWLGGRRAALVAGLPGQVVEIGAGTGANLPYYRNAERVVATEPDAAMRRRLSARLGSARVPVEMVDAAAEDLPFSDASFDAAVCTLVLCSVADLDRSLAEIRRVLRPSGQLAVIEHVRGDPRLAKWQDRLTPLWTRIGAGCHPNRDIRAAIELAGFEFVTVESFQHPPTWGPTSPGLQGVATPRP